MARLQLNKSSLAREAAQLRSYERFLPSLDLKRQQLMAERARARREVAELEEQVRALAEKVGRDVPMLGNDKISLDGLVRLRDYTLGTENVVGTRLPVLADIEVEVADYSPMAKPHWVDDVARLLHDMIEVRLKVHVAERRVELLEEAVTTITQRVNLFEKVLIPRALADIRQIRLHLADTERAAVVCAKIAKRKRRRRS